MKLFKRRRAAIEPLNVAHFVGDVDTESEQDNTPGPDGESFEQLEHDEAKSARHGGFPNFGR